MTEAVRIGPLISCFSRLQHLCICLWSDRYVSSFSHAVLVDEGFTPLGSGKSYSMMGGQGDERGIIPRLCEDLFERIEAKSQRETWTAKVGLY